MLRDYQGLLKETKEQLDRTEATIRNPDHGMTDEELSRANKFADTLNSVYSDGEVLISIMTVILELSAMKAKRVKDILAREFK